MKITIVSVLYSILSMATATDDLIEITRQAPDLSQEAKIGLDVIPFWVDILKNRSDLKNDEIPELSNVAANLVNAAKMQVNRFQSETTQAKILDDLDQAYKQYQAERQTLPQFYDFLMQLCYMAVPSHDTTFKETQDFSRKLLNLGYIIAPVFPTENTPDFDGKIGYAAVVTGLSQRIWLAGVSFCPSLSVNDYFLPNAQTSVHFSLPSFSVTPSLFLWYEIAGDAFMFLLQYNMHNLDGNFPKIRQNLEKHPTAELFQHYFYYLRKNNLGLD